MCFLAKSESRFAQHLREDCARAHAKGCKQLVTAVVFYQFFKSGCWALTVVVVVRISFFRTVNNVGAKDVGV